jgi:hypothetical protein
MATITIMPLPNLVSANRDGRESQGRADEGHALARVVSQFEIGGMGRNHAG